MGSVGDALDNAVAEGFFASLKTELLDRDARPTRRKLRTAIFGYIEGFYNRRRRHSTLGYLTPLEFKESGAPVRDDEKWPENQSLTVSGKPGQLHLSICRSDPRTCPPRHGFSGRTPLAMFRFDYVRCSSIIYGKRSGGP
ncbi:MAG TPA: transposase [Clostridia bacterium]|nr:transposase [Clostridia bacterium]